MTTILKPGILVSLKTTIKGGVHYEHKPLKPLEEAQSEGAVAQAGTAEIARWETTRIIDDPDEYERAKTARAKARSLISGVCVHTSFGLLCPESLEPELNQALADARRVAEEHNSSAGVTSVCVHVLKGRIASTDEEATRAIASEVTTLLEEMQRGIRQADPKIIREAANRARELGAVLDIERAEKVSKAVEAARSAARAIVRRVEKNGEDAELVIQELTQAPIDVARFAFLDFEAAPGVVKAEVDAEPAPGVNVQRFAELDV
jgi:sugar phosphate isomerase/epimerase